LDVLEAMAAEGKIRRISSDNRLTKGIRYETVSGQPLQLDLGNAVARLDAGRLKLNDTGQNRATVVLESDPGGTVVPAREADVAGIEYRPGAVYGGSHYSDAGSRLVLGRQALFYVDTAAGLRQLLTLYERHADRPLDKLKKRFLSAFPDFEAAGSFAGSSGSYHDSYRERVDSLLAAAAQHPADGWAVLQDVLAASQGGRGALPPFFDGDVNWRLPRARKVDRAGFDAALNSLIAGADDPSEAAGTFNAIFCPALEAIGEPNTFRDTRVVPSTVLAAVMPDRAISVRYQPYVNAERLLNDRTLFANRPMSADEYRAVLALAEQIRAGMVDWGWAPRDFWDVHGFILATCGSKDIELDDDSLLKRFASARFDTWQKSWTLDQRAAFCKIARVAHYAGLDWYHTNMAHNPVRLGRKPDVNRRARLTLGYLDQPSAPRIWLSDKAGKPALGQHAFPLDAAGADDFSKAVRKHQKLLASWDPPTPKRPGRWPDEAGYQDGDEERLREDLLVQPNPTNLILYGPPGTGKTYATAEHAVRLCGEEVPEDRAGLMATYKRLFDAGRIEFVTFHQSMAYEEFVEGLRPSSVDEDGEPLAAGFRLAPTPGIFRKIARRAELSTGAGSEAFKLGDRQVFKMSIGDATKAEWAWLFDGAIAENYAYLGFANIDWSEGRFSDRAAILEAVKAHDGPHGSFRGTTEPSLRAGAVKSPDIFRNDVKVGDVIVVSKGLELFRAIGVVEGKYEYAPRESGEYSHRRRVRWLWHDDAGVPAKEISTTRFTLDSIYPIKRGYLNIPALERYANSQQETGNGAPEPFVLIIDEINRANISKVFGELITLLEADKRIDADNELRVRLPYSGDNFGVPANLHIVGTMNTADRSIALIDKALRRRFEFVEVMPRYDLDGMDAKIADAGVSLTQVLERINDRIEYLLDREHQIGHGWLLQCDTRAKLDVAMRTKIIPLIAEYFFEDWGRAADVLGGREDNPFLDKHKLPVPRGLENAEDRFRWSLRNHFASDAYTRLVAG
jgi:hypothetical protein